MNTQKGFTLIELVMVIVILAILGSVAIPKYVDLQQEARDANEFGVSGGVRAGILTFFADPARGNLTNYPTSLDGVADNTPCTTANPCFTTVLVQGGITEQWTKISSAANTYQSPTGAIWTYDSGTGDFTRP